MRTCTHIFAPSISTSFSLAFSLFWSLPISRPLFLFLYSLLSVCLSLSLCCFLSLSLCLSLSTVSRFSCFLYLPTSQSLSFRFPFPFPLSLSNTHLYMCTNIMPIPSVTPPDTPGQAALLDPVAGTVDPLTHTPSLARRLCGPVATGARAALHDPGLGPSGVWTPGHAVPQVGLRTGTGGVPHRIGAHFGGIGAGRALQSTRIPHTGGSL